MRRPKATPILPKLAGSKDVSAGTHRLPGASAFVSPSKSRTKMTSSVDKMPIMEAYERRDKGMKSVGAMLNR
jgi:hypothetical protein